MKKGCLTEENRGEWIAQDSMACPEKEKECGWNSVYVEMGRAGQRSGRG